MQMCSECMMVYDESESTKCPFCFVPKEEFKYVIVYDEKEGIAKTVPVEEAHKYR